MTRCLFLPMKRTLLKIILKNIRYSVQSLFNKIKLTNSHNSEVNTIRFWTMSVARLSTIDCYEANLEPLIP